MRNKFPSLDSLKRRYPSMNPFYTQSWVYSAISAYYGQQDQFADLEFADIESDILIRDYDGNAGFRPGTNYYGLVFEGHVDYWASGEIPQNAVLITGHQHVDRANHYTSLGFDYWDIVVYNEFRSATLGYEINYSSVQTAQYDAVVALGTQRPHRITFLKQLNEQKQDLTIVTDDNQKVLDTDLRFSSLGVEVYLNKVGLKEYQLHYVSPSFYDTNTRRSLDHLPHKKMHSIAKVTVVLETTMYNTLEPYLTEKTYKTLAQHRPFIIIGDTNILKKLQAQGFKTFDKYCDESYDTVSDPILKGQMAISALNQLVESCKRYPDEIDQICKHNQQLFFNQQRHTDNLATFGKNLLEIIK